LALLLVALGVSAERATAGGTSYADANDAYKAGKWDVAVSQYEALVDAGIVHPDLYYNLGNAYFRCATESSEMKCPGGIGHAIYNYERALRLQPDFRHARENLRLARETVATRWEDRLEDAESDPLWMTVVTFLSIGQLTIMFLIFDVLLFAGLTVNRFMATGFVRTALRVTNSFAAIGLLLAAVLLAGHIYFLEEKRMGIVLPDQLQMREGTDPRSAERAQIHAGLRVEILGQEQGWLRVQLANGHEGWVPDDAVGEL
jgi:hypothetical protein